MEEYKANERFAQNNHKRKLELIRINKQISDEKQKRHESTISFLWELKFKFLREQNDLYIERIEKVMNLRNQIR